MKSPQQQFREDGYVLYRNLLSPAEVAEYKAKMQRLSHLTDKDFDRKKARLGGWNLADGVTKLREWWPIITHPRLVQAAREVLGPTARYTQHSDLHVHHGTVGWHRDSANRTFGVGPDWDESKDKYQIARVAIYLQSYSESGSELGVVPESHNKESSLTRLELQIHDKMKRLFKRPDWLLPLLTVRPVWIKTDPGDCVFFNQRILHTGSHIHGPKYAIFLSYGADNEHSRNHRRYYLFRRKDLKYDDFHPDLAEQLRKANLLLELKETREPVGV